MAQAFGFNEEGTRRVVNATRWVERAKRNPRPLPFTMPISREGCWIRLDGKTEVEDSSAIVGVVGAYNWTLAIPDLDHPGSYVDHPAGITGEYNADPELDQAAYEQNHSNANLHLNQGNVVRARPGRRRPNGVYVLVFDKGLTDEPYEARYLFNPSVSSCSE